MSGRGIWTDELEARLKRLWREGLSGGQIAKTFSAELGRCVTRSAVIGKLNRLGVCRDVRPRKDGVHAGALLSARLKSEHMRRRAPKREAPSAVRPARPRVGDAFVLADGQAGVAFMALEPHHCRWPCDGPDGGTLFCGAPKRAGGSYCASHAARAKGGASSSKSTPVRPVTGANRPALIFGGG